MTDQLFALRDEAYACFQRRLIPNLPPETIIGVRTPQLRELAKTVNGMFLQNLPHRYFEENQIHAFSLERIPDFDQAVWAVEAFLPYVDNWTTCDQLRPKVFSKHKERLLPYIRKWLKSTHPYTVRFGIEMLMCHYLDSDFSSEYPALVASVRSDDYYVRMMIAWYFATALAKQYDAVLPYISERRLEPWIHSKTIQKATESNRLTLEQKEKLRTYRKYQRRVICDE